MTQSSTQRLHLDLWFECGETSLEVRHLSVREAISSPFVVGVMARSPRSTIDLDGITGKAASLTLRGQDGPVRTWKGVCSHIGQMKAMPTDQRGSLSTYQFEIVPTLWLLAHRTGHRIYQHLSIPDIVDKLLAEWSIQPTWKIDRGSYPALEYKVQHGESDYDFLSRLLEEAGIAFTFSDQGGAPSKLTLSDNLIEGALHRDSPIPFRDDVGAGASKPTMQDVRLVHQVRPGKVTLREHDFRKPAYPLFGRALPEAAAPENRYEQYRYDAGAFLSKSTGGADTPVADRKGVYRPDEKHGNDLATRTLQAIRADKRVVAYSTNVVELAPGTLFKIEGHHHPELQSGTLLVTELAVTGAHGDDWSIEGTAVFADPKSPYRPPRKTPKPIIPGPQSATVVGPIGREIHVDEHGRVRVQFPWDREGKNDDDSSCWLRVSQGWAGSGFGMITLPRIGQEVLVAFLDGDPDMPIIVGRTFNALQPVPYALPENQTVSTWKSRSSPGGEGFNEIKFEDKKDHELVYMQAERDRHTLVKHDEVERVGHTRHVTVGSDPRYTQGPPLPDDGNDDLVIKGTHKRLVYKGEHVHVKAGRSEQIDGAVSLTIGLGRDEKVLGAHALEAATIHVKAGSTLVLEAGMRLTIKSSGGFIDINPSGIDIVGLTVNINSGGEAGAGPGAHPTRPLPAVEAHPKDTPTR
ncbi:Hypothetical protein A7982_04660 [Minicystis rosea]|nr:Hypothetical protein A7982_04660 [Minicystis rosea]